MNFICTEFDQNINNLYLKRNTDESSIYKNNYLYTKTNKLNTKDGIIFSYTTDIVRKLLYSQFVDDYTVYTPAGWITNKSLTGTDHTGTSSTFVFKTNSCSSLISSYFYTIIAEDGIHFAYPARLSTSKQIINFDVVSQYISQETSYNYQRETGSTYIISNQSNDTILPSVIDSTLKSKRINKYKSKQNIITIQSGVDANPLDYVLWNGNYYLLITKSEIKTDLYLYTCVKEDTTTNTISSYDMYPFYEWSRRQYIGGQTYNGVTLNVTTTNGTLIRGVFIPYQTIDGAWRLKFNIVFTYSPSVGSSTITITGITTKNISNYHQSISWQYPGGASTGQAYFDPGASTAQIKVSGTGYSELGISGDIELDSKPTWVY